MLQQMALFHSFLWLSSIPLFVNTTSLSIHVSGHVGCFHVLAIVKSAAMNIEVHASFQIMVSLDICLGVGLLDHMTNPFLVF